MADTKNPLPPHAKWQEQKNNERALVTITNGQQPIRRQAPAVNATEHILQENIRALRSQLAEANARCEQLTAENDELKQKIVSLEESHEVRSPSEYSVSTQPLRPEPITSGTSAAQPSSEQNQIDIIVEILKEQTAKIQQLEAQAASSAQNAASLAAFEDRVKHVEITVDVVRNSGASYGEEVERTKAQLASLTNKIENVETRLDVVQEAGNSYADEVEKMKSLIMPPDEMAEQEVKIDDAFTKEQLLDYYKLLDLQIREGFSDGEFKGTENQLWALRRRVVRRYATFDIQSQAAIDIRDRIAWTG